jgi:hypothetical protein
LRAERQHEGGGRHHVRAEGFRGREDVLGGLLLGLGGSARSQADRNVEKGVIRIAVGDDPVIAGGCADADAGERKHACFHRCVAQDCQKTGNFQPFLKIGGIVDMEMRHVPILPNDCFVK